MSKNATGQAAYYSNEDGDAWVLASAAATEEEAAAIAISVTGEPVTAWGKKEPVIAQFQDDEYGHVCGPDGCLDHPECASTGCPPPFTAQAWAFEESYPWSDDPQDGSRFYKPDGWKPWGR